MASMDSQRRQVLRHLMKHAEGLTGLEMVTLYGALNYKNVVFELRNAGVPIAGEWEYRYDMEGREERRWMRYYIPREAMTGKWVERWKK